MIADLETLAAAVPDGAKLAVPTDYSGVALAATLALIGRGACDLHLVCVPTSGLQADLLIGAGAVKAIETSAVTLGEYGAAPCFVRAARAGAIELLDATCPAIHAGLTAAEKGLPFAPLPGLLGTDLLRHRPDWREIDDPSSGERYVAVSAIRPDVALFHAPFADRAGNVWIGRRRELVTLAHASRQTFVTVEEVREGDLLADETLAAGVLPALYVSGVVAAPRGAWPLAFADRYAADEAALMRYADEARTPEGFARILKEWRGRRASTP